ncbi:MAG: hypothetical protein O9262_12515 [Cyclobacteriaceae bacterium]|nr:hypothetical protein [Cyclobacteriaceae bacterium]
MEYLDNNFNKIMISSEMKDVKLPTHEELLLYLIAQDLKSRKFFDGLRDLGLDDDYYQADLSELVLIYMGLSTLSDEPGDLYYSLLGKYTENLPADKEALQKASHAVYQSLLLFRDEAKDFS